MNIISMEILRKAKDKKENLQSGIMVIMWKTRGKMVISPNSRKKKEERNKKDDK